MKVTLSTEDLEKIILEKFDGVSSVKFGSTGEAELDVDYSNFKEKKAVSEQELRKTFPKANVTTTIPNTPPPTEEKTQKEIKQGVMVSGGEQRSIQHMG